MLSVFLWVSVSVFVYACRPVCVCVPYPPPHCHSCYNDRCLLLICRALGGCSNVGVRFMNVTYYCYHYYYCLLRSLDYQITKRIGVVGVPDTTAVTGALSSALVGEDVAR